MDEESSLLGAHVGVSVFPVPGRPGVATLKAVRGDSRRDLYAKTLALFGLGVLAGAGAVVDYWPVGVKLSVGESAFAHPVDELPGPLAVPDSFAIAEPSGVPEGAEHSARAAADPVRRAAAPLRVVYAALPADRLEFDLGSPLDLQPLPPPELVLVRNDLSMASMPVRLTAPDGPSRRADTTAVGAGPQGSGDGFIAGAFRKTGSSIIDAGARTGGSLVGAVRVVGSMFRRALPD